MDQSNGELGVGISDTSKRRLGGVDYYLARKGQYPKLHRFAEEEGFERTVFEFPTIVAEKDGEIVGILSTSTKSGLIVVGPLVLKTDRPRRMTALRLIEVYDALMRSMGIVTYIFASRTDGPFDPLIKKMGLEPYAEQDGDNYYIRRL